MLPVLEAARAGERKIGDVVDEVSQAFGLSEEERATLLPSGKQTVIANRVHWARTYLKQAGRLSSPGRPSVGGLQFPGCPTAAEIGASVDQAARSSHRHGRQVSCG
jgi:restriction endonuclease Mrr